MPHLLGTDRSLATSQSETTAGEGLGIIGVGQHQMWAIQHYAVERTRSFLSSSGFRTAGYGLPAAIGAKVAAPDSFHARDSKHGIRAGRETE